MNEINPDKSKRSLKLYRTAKKNPLLALASLIVAAVFLITLLGTILEPHDPLETNLSLRLAKPSLQYPFGNDTLGRCLLSRILSGARISVGLGFAVVGFSCLFGMAVGLLSGYRGGLIDETLMRITDIFFSFPEIIAAMTVAGLMGPGTVNMISALSLVSWMRYARVVRGVTLSVREREYIKAARLSGVSGTVIILRHILPANLPSVIVLATIGLAKAILAISALGFLGFGAQPPTPEWGTLLMEGKDFILTAPHLSLYPGLAIMITALAFNLAGDGLRDVCLS
jgi:peptide/nickel transport system permease protein